MNATKRRASGALAALALVVAGLGSGVAAPPAAATADAGPVITPVTGCADLVGDLAIPGATAHVTSATVVPTGAEPEHCDVRGHVDPAVNFQLKLPTATYTGRYLQYGCGGFCGTLGPTPFPDCGPGAGDLAVATTDDGHVGQGPLPSIDGRWGADDQAARDDLAFRAPHVVSVTAKRLIAAFYGAPPARSYFGGCSNGGREALLLAQRHPHDFDGIIAGAPANYLSPLVMYQAWLHRANTGPAGDPILTPGKLQPLHQAVLTRCDHLDGLVDGQLDDPRRCDFDPATTACPDGVDQPTCLTPAQVETVRKLYAGPTDPRGGRLYPGAQTRGSELAWAGWILPVPEFGGSVAHLLADNYLKYLGYPIGTPHSSADGIRFTARELHRLTPVGARGNAMALDLGEFRRSGGKLILWHGWNDQGIPAAGLLDYYARLTHRNGGPEATRQWARVFMVPSLHHCGGGGTLTEFDPLREMVAWVERGTAPDRVIATGRDTEGDVVRTRPVFPYPLQAKYDGTGSIDEASNFVPTAPLHAPQDTIQWLGTYLHAIPGPVVP